MPRTTRLLPALLLLCCLPPAASAEGAAPAPLPLALAARHQPGDAYALALTARTDTRAASQPGATGFAEDVALAYEAHVVVLAVDGDGRAVRELHDRVRLTATRGDETLSLFRPGAAFEVRRSARGVRVYAGEQRLDRKLETIVADLLASRIEDSSLPALLDPGRPVAAGERWTLDRGLAKRLLRERGVRVVEFGDEAPSAWIEEDADGGGTRRLRYRIPVAWLELARMPADRRTARSDAVLEGTIELAPDGRARSHDDALTLALRGVTVRTGLAAARPWRLDRARTTAQRSEPLQRVAVSGF